MELFDLTGEIAVLIGAGGALGSAMAKGLAAAGAAVAILDLNPEAAEKVAAEIRATGRQAIAVAANALDRASLEKARDTVKAQLGQTTVLLNACGGNSPRVTVTDQKRFEDIALDDWKWGVDLNLVGGAVLPCQVFGPAMCQAGKGSIINIASVSAHIPLSRVVAYSAAKAGVVSLTMFLAREWATCNVRVNSITPGFFPAEQNRALLFNPDGSPTERGKAILGHTPMHRLGKPEELVGAVIFLASGKASGFVTGADLKVDGGFLAQTI